MAKEADNLTQLGMTVTVDDLAHLEAVQNAFRYFTQDLQAALSRRPHPQYGLREIEARPVAHGVTIRLVCTANGPVPCDIAVVKGHPEPIACDWFLPVELTVAPHRFHWAPGLLVDIHQGQAEGVRCTLVSSDYLYTKRGPFFASCPDAKPSDVITLSGEWSDGPSPKALELSKKYAKETT